MAAGGLSHPRLDPRRLPSPNRVHGPLQTSGQAGLIDEAVAERQHHRLNTVLRAELVHRFMDVPLDGARR